MPEERVKAEELLGRHPAEIAAEVEHLPEREILQILLELPRELAGDLLEQLRPRLSARLVSHLDPEEASELLEEMAPDEAADVLEQLPEAEQQEILEQMAEDEAKLLEELIAYPPDTAGGIMSPDVVALSRELRVEEALAELRRIAEEVETVYYVYVVDEEHHLLGVIPMRDLALSPPRRQITEVMVPEVLKVEVGMDKEEVAHLFEQYDYLALPVVDPQNRLLGIVTADDVLDVVRQEATEDFLKFGGISGGEEYPLTPARFSIRRRLPWMAANILFNLIAVSAIALFESTLARVVALAVIMPIISDMGGNVGLQALSVSIRGLAVGEVSIKLLWRVVRKELTVGLVNGLILGLQLGLIAYFWRGSPFLGLVASLALWINTIVAGVLGAALPILLKWLGLDPAMMTGAILTTITDFSGFFIFLGLGTLLLARL